MQIKTVDGTKGWVASWLVKAEVPKPTNSVGTAKPAGSTNSAGATAGNTTQAGTTTQTGTTTKTPERIATVKGSTVNLRSGPSTSYAVAGKTVKGEQVQVLEGKQDWLKVRLANGSVGWVASWLVTQKVQVVKVEETTPKPDQNNIPVAEPVSNTNVLPNLIDYNIETATESKVWINGQEALDYETSEQQEPHRLVVKLKNASMLGNTRENILNSQGLLKVTANNVEGIKPAVVLTLELEPGVKWVAKPGETTKTLLLTKEVTPDNNSSGAGQEPNTPNEQGTSSTTRTVTIDAGHGGIDPGAVGPSKLQEKDVVFDISMRLGQKLEAAGYRVVYTRQDDTKISLTRRPAIAAENNSDIFISVHANSSENPLTHGTSTYYYAPESDPVLSAQASERRRLAELVQQKMVAAVGRKDLGIFQANFAVLRGTTMPSILAEVAYICNLEEEALLAQENIRDKFATAIFEGVFQYFQESPAPQPIDNQVPSILQ